MNHSVSTSTPSSQSGFTLIELMIVIAIVGILTAIAVVSYQIHIRRTDVAIIYQELNHFRLPYEVLVDEGEDMVDFTVSGLNMPANSNYCQYDVVAPKKVGITEKAISCTISNVSYLKNETVSLDRAIDGTWSCRASSGISRAYLPLECRQN